MCDKTVWKVAFFSATTTKKNARMYKSIKFFGPGTSREGPGKVPGWDLETLKVPWSRGPGTKEVQKSRDLKIGKVPGQWKPYLVRVKPSPKKEN